MQTDAADWPLAGPRVPIAAAAVELARISNRRRRGEQAVRAYQLDRIRALVAHAAIRVPAYRGVLTEQHAARLQSLEDVSHLPIVDKDHFLAREGGAWSVPGAPMRLRSTSGTSAQPFEVP